MRASSARPGPPPPEFADGVAGALLRGSPESPLGASLGPADGWKHRGTHVEKEGHSVRGRLLLIAGLITGFVLGSRAGQRAYDQLRTRVQSVSRNPAVQSRVAKARDFAQ